MEKSDNELIAQFMGFVQSKSSLGNTWEHPERMGIYGGVGLKLKYDTSWDWLMPVVEKIGQLEGDYTVSINTEKEPSLYGHECSIYDTGHTVSFMEESKILIEAVYKAVVEFIRWYNSQSPATIK